MSGSVCHVPDPVSALLGIIITVASYLILISPCISLPSCLVLPSPFMLFPVPFPGSVLPYVSTTCL